jgi:hypothetical protein
VEEQEHAEIKNHFRWLNSRQPVAANGTLALKALSVAFSRKTICRHDPDVVIRKDPESVEVLDSLYDAIDLNRLETLCLDFSGSKALHIIKRLLIRNTWPSVNSLYIIDNDGL